MPIYSQDLRDRVLQALDRGERPIDIAKHLEVSRVWIYQVKGRLETDGQRTAKRVGGYKVSRVAAFEDSIRSWIKVQPDLTLVQICERLEKDFNISIKPPALWHQMNKWGLSYKKNSIRRRAAS